MILIAIIVSVEHLLEAVNRSQIDIKLKIILSDRIKNRQYL